MWILATSVPLSVWIVLDGSNLGWNAILVALKVDDTIQTLVAAALMTDGQPTLLIAAGALLQRLGQAGLGLGLLVDAVETGDRHLTSGGSRRLKSFDRHIALLSFRYQTMPSKNSMVLESAASWT